LSSQRLHWGLLLPQGANLELAGLTGAEGWSKMLATAAEAERLEYDSLWAVDRLETLPRREPEPVFDGWTTLAAVSQHIKRIQLAHLGVGAPLRNVAQLAKRAACLDIMSGGRMTLAVDSNGYPSEHEAHGETVPGPEARNQAAAETVQVLRRLWSEPEVSCQGEHIQLARAFSAPKPVRGRLGLHVLDAGPGQPDSVLASLDPRDLDGVIWHATPEQVRTGVDDLVRRCEATGDDPNRIERTVLLECRIFDSAIDRDRWLATPYVVIFWSEHPDLYMQRNAAGTVAAVRTQLQRYVDAGATQFLVWFRDYPDLTSMRQLTTQVARGLPGPRPLADQPVPVTA
jgi:alkanesulfonate monooxygenase SsuD/methylene tetrahydromethanopterin reductase-like flavin-dependent oxidoreductase (luciferase family)